MDPLQCAHAREITSHVVIGEDPLTAQRVFALDAPYSYAVTDPSGLEITEVRFQRGKPHGGIFNGVYLMALLAIEIDVLEQYQAGPFCCAQNLLALDHLRAALLYLGNRQADRIRRHVAGEAKP